MFIPYLLTPLVCVAYRTRSCPAKDEFDTYLCLKLIYRADVMFRKCVKDSVRPARRGVEGKGGEGVRHQHKRTRAFCNLCIRNLA